MKRIKKYISSPLNVLHIVYGEEVVSFNLAEEARIDENKIEDEIKNQPSNYAFVSMLHKKMMAEFERLKQRRKAMYGRLFLSAKKGTGTGRGLSDEAAKAKVESNKKYIKLTQRCIDTREMADKLYSATRVFEMRANMMQTLSSNLRKER
jgi:hypothetical protein